jgi:DNA replication protein DnaC
MSTDQWPPAIWATLDRPPWRCGVLRSARYFAANRCMAASNGPQGREGRSCRPVGELAGCDWVREHRHCLLTGPCGVGKSWLACALGYKACRENLSVLYHRVPRLFALLSLARGDGRYAKMMRQLGRVDPLILDDWGPEPLLPEQQRDLLEIVEDRYNAGSLIITSQLPVDRWYELVGNPTLADAILDRIVHNAYRVELSGESLRKQRASA